MIEKEHPVAFFCCEYAVSASLPLFTGGLGVLAGDFLLETHKQNFPLIALGLAFHPVEKSLETVGFSQEYKVNIFWEGKDLTVPVWKKNNLYLLDGGEITQVPYGPDYWTMLKQQMILAFGGVQLLKILGITPAVYHLNEGHTALTILALLKENHGAHLPIVATKHTVLSESGTMISREDFGKVLAMVWPEKLPEADKLFALGDDEKHRGYFSTNKFLISFARVANGVSNAHVAAEKEAHPNSTLFPVTNGVNLDRWRSSSLSLEIGQYSDVGLWQAHEGNRYDLVNFINRETKTKLDPNVLTIVWARRLARYKQPEVIFSIPNALDAIVNNPHRPVQIVLCGPAKVSDPSSLAVARQLTTLASQPAFKDKVVFLPRYDLNIAKILTCGADVWLNTPDVGKEACGTSGMKAGLNGALLLSTPDGWAAEIDPNPIGWALSKDETARNFYRLVADEIGPTFYQRNGNNVPPVWIHKMRAMINLVTANFTTARMLEDYKKKLYA